MFKYLLIYCSSSSSSSSSNNVQYLTAAGTYNNQYMVIDLKKVQLGRQLANGTLWVIEQIPGLVVGADQTTLLRAGNYYYYQAAAAANTTIIITTTTATKQLKVVANSEVWTVEHQLLYGMTQCYLSFDTGECFLP